MAMLSSHTLNGVDGTHADGINITLIRLSGAGPTGVVLDGETNEGGRFSHAVDLTAAASDDRYELVFLTSPYWAKTLPYRDRPQIMREVVVRLSMADPAGHYHIPVILSPNSYSVWWSS